MTNFLLILLLLSLLLAVAFSIPPFGEELSREEEEEYGPDQDLLTSTLEKEEKVKREDGEDESAEDLSSSSSSSLRRATGLELEEVVLEDDDIVIATTAAATSSISSIPSSSSSETSTTTDTSISSSPVLSRKAKRVEFDEYDNQLSKLSLQDLTYSYNSLEPMISENTMRIHHDKHHLKYISNAKALIEVDSSYSLDMSLENIMFLSKAENKTPLFNNAAQSWNHAFYWYCLQPPLESGAPSNPNVDSAIYDEIVLQFGTVEAFKIKLIASINAVFGSGWTWLVLNKAAGKLEIVNSANGENPMTEGKVPLLTIDVWEHAYYLDYQNVRANYANALVDSLINWDYVEHRFQKFADLYDTNDEL